MLIDATRVPEDTDPTGFPGTARLARSVATITRRVLRQPDEAADAAQDAWVSILRGLPGFDHRARLGTWAHRIAVNAALMRRRARLRRREVSDETPGVAEPVTPAEVSPEWLVIRQEMRRHVRQALATLEAGQREILTLRYVRDRDPAEIADRLGISRTAAKLRLLRARRALRAHLTPRGT